MGGRGEGGRDGGRGGGGGGGGHVLFLGGVVGIVHDRGRGGRREGRRGGGRGIELLEKAAVGVLEALTGI